LHARLEKKNTEKGTKKKRAITGAEVGGGRILSKIGVCEGKEERNMRIGWCGKKRKLDSYHFSSKKRVGGRAGRGDVNGGSGARTAGCQREKGIKIFRGVFGKFEKKRAVERRCRQKRRRLAKKKGRQMVGIYGRLLPGWSPSLTREIGVAGS